MLACDQLRSFRTKVVMAGTASAASVATTKRVSIASMIVKPRLCRVSTMTALDAGLAPLVEGGACAQGPVGNLTGEAGHRKREPGHSRPAVQNPAPGRCDIWGAAPWRGH